MTASDWASSADPVRMLAFLRTAAVSDRKYRLFACACCRRIWDCFPDDRNRALVAAVEDFPDGRFEDPAIHDAAVASSACESECRGVPAYWVAKYLGRGFYKMTAGMSAAVVVCKVLFLDDRDAGREVEDGTFIWMDGGPEPVRLLDQLPAGVQARAGVLAALLRDVIGNPLTTVPLDPSWRTGNCVALARRMYDGRDFGLMPILADALEDAGCQNDAVLGHGRGPNTHVRGCWLIDGLLQKA